MNRSITIIICTRDRSDSLVHTMHSIGRSEVPCDWHVELLVVDNGSKDSTRVVVEKMTLPNIPVRYIFEPRKGKGYAYNAGMEAANSCVFLFTDDDVRVPVNWIKDMCQPILEKKSVAVQGGIKIAPHLERPWLTGVLRVWVAAVEDPERQPEGLVGANMSFDRQALKATGGFDVRLGPGAAGFFDDTLFGWLLQQGGNKILYQPQVAVDHHFDPARLKIGSFINTAQRMAESRALVMQILEPGHPRPSLLELVREIPGLVVRSITQIVNFLRDRRPDAGFIFRYYRICLWRAQRRESTLSASTIKK